MWLEASRLARADCAELENPLPPPTLGTQLVGRARTEAGISISLPSPRPGKVLHSKVPPVPWPREPIEWGGRKHAGENVHSVARGWS